MNPPTTINEKIIAAMHAATAPHDDADTLAAMDAQADAAQTVLADVLNEYATALTDACAKVHRRRPAPRESAEPCASCRANVKAIRQAARIVGPDPRD